MRVGFYQFEPGMRNRALNVGRMKSAVERVEADLVVMPEMCTAGYLFPTREELLEYAEPVPDGPTCRELTEVCQRRNTAVVFGMAEKAGDRLYNSAVLITPEGRVSVYRKAHLFWDEKDIFTPGDLAFPVFEVDSVKVGMLVCFDHFFPEAARALALKGAQLICHPSNLVLDVAHVTTTCRCIENRVFWILANRTGVEQVGGKELRFIGRSQITAPGGRLLYRAGTDTEELPVIEIDPGEALDKQATPRNHLLKDRRTDLY